MPAALLAQIILALIGQAPAILQLIEKLKGENRDTLTQDEVDGLKSTAPVAHQLLLAAAGQPSCPTCASVVATSN